MRILLVAYEFPPSRSPRALRWRYFVRELALLGHDVHVLVPDLGEPGVSFPSGPGSVQLHRVFAGPLAGMVSWLAKRTNPGHGDKPGHDVVATSADAAIRLNWKGRLVDSLRSCLGVWLFPDARAEWSPWARFALKRLLASLVPDVVITSHEPASTLPLGRLARRRGFAWVADLGDPVCAPYTARRWRRRARALETAVAVEANLILVPNEAARNLLVARHGLATDRCMVISQGYDDRRAAVLVPTQASIVPDQLELLYTGRLYGFRDPTNLFRAIAACEGVQLTLVLGDPPPADALAGIDVQGRLRIMGPLAHADVLTLQERADVLLSFGNRGMPAQIPGKLFEYLGVGKPILHIHTGVEDAAAPVLDQLHRGWLCADDTVAITAMLVDLLQRKRAGQLTAGLQLSPVPEYAVSTLGRRLSDALEDAAGQAAHHRRSPDRAHD